MRNVLIVISALAALHAAFIFPVKKENASMPGKQAAQNKKTAQTVAPMTASPKPGRPSAQTSGQTTSGDAAASGESLSLPSEPAKPVVPDLAALRAKFPASQEVPVPAEGVTKSGIGTAPAAVAPSINDLQLQLNQILRLNEQLQHQYTNQVREIQRIAEQARIHQKILTDIEDGRRTAEPTAADINKVLEQAKIRVIRDETSKSSQFIANLRDQPSAGQAKKDLSLKGEGSRTI